MNDASLYANCCPRQMRGPALKGRKIKGLGGRYFRFNVDRGLGGVGLDEYSRIDRIEAATVDYLENPRVKESVNSFTSVRAPQART